MELREVVRRRRMVRRFDPSPLPAEVLDRILHSATTPSAGSGGRPPIPASMSPTAPPSRR
jgi:nitroreductase